MPITWGTGAVTCSEEKDTAVENISLTAGLSASVTLRCAYTNRAAAAADIIGTAWPKSGGTNKPVATSIAIRHVEATSSTDGSGIIYEDALLDVTYSSGEITDLISESIEPQTEFQIQDHKKFRWGSGTGDPLTEKEAPGKIIRGLSLVRTYYQLSSLPTLMLTAPGGVNDADYNSAILGLTFEEETLLLGDPVSNRVIDASGDYKYNLTLKFSINNQGWNKYWRADAEEYQEIYVAGETDPHKSYPPTDFSSLFS